jgi:cytochrome c oxidase subunit 2
MNPPADKYLPFPPNLSVHGPAIDHLIDYVHWLMYALFIVWGIYFVYVLIRFRMRAGHQAAYQPAKGKIAKSAEVAVIVAEAVLLVGLSMPVWAKYKDTGSVQNAIHVKVTAEQFAWNFHYPGKDGIFGRTDPKLMNNSGNSLGIDMTDPHAKDDIITLNEFHIPIHQPVIVELSSKDVIHSFTINVLRVKQDVIPGMLIPIHFEATAKGTGTYDISCAQLCGLGHYRMQGFVYLDTPEEYAQWLAQKESEQQGVTQ